MNNNVNNQLPNVPANIDAWKLFSELHGCTTDFDTTDAENLLFRLNRRTLLVQLEGLSQTRCEGCSGYGHSAKVCPTHTRLTAVGSGGWHYSKLVAWGRK